MRAKKKRAKHIEERNKKKQPANSLQIQRKYRIRRGATNERIFFKKESDIVTAIHSSR